MSTEGKSRRAFLVDSVTGLGGAWVPPTTRAFSKPKSTCARPPVGPAGEVRVLHRRAGGRHRCDGLADHSDRRDAGRARGARHQLHRPRAGDLREDDQAAYTQGLKDLQAKTKELFPSATKFSALTSPQQIQVLTAIEKTPFFNTVRNHTVIGFFASPVHGGNHDKVGWKLIGYDDSLKFKPPFGYYDAQDPAGRR